MLAVPIASYSGLVLDLEMLHSGSCPYSDGHGQKTKFN